MKTLNAKKEAIKKAYGEYWENVKDYVDNDGWIDNSIPKFTFGQLKNLDLEYKNDVFLRPKSLHPTLPIVSHILLKAYGLFKCTAFFQEAY